MSEIPYDGQINKGDVLSFNMNGRMIPVEVCGIGYYTIEIVSLDLKWKWRISKAKWVDQKRILESLKSPSTDGQ